MLTRRHVANATPSSRRLRGVARRGEPCQYEPYRLIMNRAERLSRILEIIQEQNISTQEELAAALRAEGCEVTQATVSRDIRELHLRKVRQPGAGPRYAAADAAGDAMIARFGRVMKDGIVSIDQAQNILVIKTVSGMAMGVAAAVDAMQYPEVVGSIAGDDTIMVAVRTVEDTSEFMKKLEKML